MIDLCHVLLGLFARIWEMFHGKSWLCYFPSNATMYQCWDSHGPNGHAPHIGNTPKDQMRQIPYLHHVHLHLSIVHLYYPESFRFLSPDHSKFHLSIVLGHDLIDFGPLTGLLLELLVVWKL